MAVYLVSYVQEKYSFVLGKRTHSISSDGSNRLCRCKVRAPGFAHLAGSDFIMRREWRTIRGEKHADTVLYRRMPVSLPISHPKFTFPHSITWRTQSRLLVLWYERTPSLSGRWLMRRFPQDLVFGSVPWQDCTRNLVLTLFTGRSIDEFCRVSNESRHFPSIKHVSICERTSMKLPSYMDEMTSILIGAS